MKMKIGVIMALSLLAAVVSASGAEKKTFKAVVDPDGIQRVSVTGGEYYFDPEHIIVRVNVPVEMTVKKEGGFTPHNIVMEEPEAGMNFEEGMGTDGRIIRFTPLKTGKFPFYCTKRFLFFKSHRDRGMEGTLEVVE